MRDYRLQKLIIEQDHLFSIIKKKHFQCIKHLELFYGSKFVVKSQLQIKHITHRQVQIRVRVHFIHFIQHVQFQVNNQSALSLSQSSPKRPGLNREISKEDFDLDINNMQAELDNLKVGQRRNFITKEILLSIFNSKSKIMIFKQLFIKVR